jgi:hypothetical protein
MRYALNPERLVRARPKVAFPLLPFAIGLILQSEDDSIIDDRVDSPTLTAAVYVE